MSDLGASRQASAATRALDTALASDLIATQFPQWSDLPVTPVSPGGFDNAAFRLGDSMVVRLPRAQEYSVQVEKEHRWLPLLAPLLPVQIPTPLALGRPGSGYPWPWSIRTWIEGEIATPHSVNAGRAFGVDLARLLRALHRIDTAGAPAYGAHSFHRGGPLRTYDAAARRAFDVLRGQIDARAAHDVWARAVDTAWNRPAVWIHGDLAAGNVLVHAGRLRGVIDWELMGIGDPACDLALAWTLLDDSGRRRFRDELALDADTWARGRAWALWKGAIVAAGLVETNVVEAGLCRRALDAVLGDDD